MIGPTPHAVANTGRLPLAALLVAFALLSPAPAQPAPPAPAPARPKPPEPVTISIDPATRHQEILGFGCSGAWWAPAVGAWPDHDRATVLDLLFTDRGANLSIYRHVVGAGSAEDVTVPSRRTKPLKPDRESPFDWSADAPAAGVLQGAVERGVQRVTFCSHSPPSWMLKNKQASGGDRGQPNLPPAEHAAFATFLLDVATHYVQLYNIPFAAASPLNEPQWRWGQRTRTREGCAFDPPQAVELLRACVEESSLREPPIAIEGPELGQWAGSSLEYLLALAQDELVRDGLSSITIHSYWSSRIEREKAGKLLPTLFPRTPIHMSEWCDLLPGRADDGPPAIESALLLASTIHEDLTLAGAAAWSFWLGASPHDSRDGLVAIDEPARHARPTPRLWALAHYSRHARPGSRRVECSARPPGTLATAFTTPDQSCVLVLVNPSPASRAVTIDCPSFPRTVSVHLTDATRAHAELPHEPTLVLPPRSIATVRLAP